MFNGFYKIYMLILLLIIICTTTFMQDEKSADRIRIFAILLGVYAVLILM